MNNLSIAQLQTDLATKLQGETFFASINIVLLREKLFESELQLATVWQTPKGAAPSVGLGIVVMMPVAAVQDAEAPGPELIFTQTIIVLEEPNLNQHNIGQADGGTGLFAEDVGAAIVAILHEFQLGQDVTLFARGQVITPNRDYENVRAVNVDLEYRLTPAYNPKVASVQCAIAGGDAALTCATAGATIYYTLDGTFPGPANAAAHTYAAPFAVASGQTIRVAATLAGSLGSDCWQYIAP